eukprot:gnl/MRDRNA2_/MRDRNA2_140544_c0_seq1.p1 gnl/MRDRNA2_/MRDRNA2_140544_c0~~gnl/MRDRNA2_/MRDRNA2_140544_c0_seq1.p1  ORF type:complete len:186 (-),score=47.35 gnl/MRDRNA2_/MRDRNA2_140544_c0_seq1:149-706(-)
MEKAFSSFPNAEFDVKWSPYQLMRNAPTASKLDGYLMFMRDESRVREYWKRLESEGKETDIKFEFDGQMSDTFDAHRLAEWALATAGAKAQDQLVEAQFSEYMEKGSPPNDRTSLLRAVEKVGLDVAAATQILDSNAYQNETRKKIAEAQKKGVQGVPHFFVNGQSVGSGAMPSDSWRQMLKQVT